MQLSSTERKIIENSIRDIKDFPKPGIVFKDITTLLNDKEAYGILMNHLHEKYKTYNLDYIAGIDARGFILGSAVAYQLGAGFVPIRKKGKLPWNTISESYTLEYGSNTVEMHEDALSLGSRVLLVDDLLATGGTARAAVNLLEKCGAQIEEVVFFIELGFLKGRSKFSGHNLRSLLVY